jgi:hypothetical protein
VLGISLFDDLWQVAFAIPFDYVWECVTLLQSFNVWPFTYSFVSHY